MKTPSAEYLLKKYQIHPRKTLGQNFLIARPTIEKIVESIKPSPSDNVLEIGPGLGIMTELLASKVNKVFAVEKDIKMAEIISSEFGHLSNIHLVTKDILQINFADDLKDAHFPIKVIGNIPYNISTPIIFLLLENRALLKNAILTIQKEVASRIVAKPGTKDYGILSIFCQVEARCEKLFDIGPGNFVPPPAVVSSVIKLDFVSPLGHEKIIDRMHFKKIVKAAFGKRRKTIRNSLLMANNIKISPDKLDSALTACNIDPKMRPEQIEIAKYIKLANQLD